MNTEFNNFALTDFKRRFICIYIIHLLSTFFSFLCPWRCAPFPVVLMTITTSLTPTHHPKAKESNVVVLVYIEY